MHEYPSHLMPVKETEYAAKLAMRAREYHQSGVTAAGIVGRADLSLGDAVEEVWEACLKAIFQSTRHRFRTVRYSMGSRR